MTDPWDDWDRRVRLTGRVNEAAKDLTDPELLTLLAWDCSGSREVEKAILRREALRRLPLGQQGAAAEAESLLAGLSRDREAPQSGRKRALKEALYARMRDAVPVSELRGSSEPDAAAHAPEAFSHLPSPHDYADRR